MHVFKNMFLEKLKKHVFYVFYLQINVFDIYDLKDKESGGKNYLIVIAGFDDVVFDRSWLYSVNKVNDDSTS